MSVKKIIVGYTNPRCYGYAKICYANPQVQIRFIPSFPFYRFGIKRNNGLFWIKYFFYTNVVDIIHSWNSVVVNRKAWVVSYESSLPYFNEERNPVLYKYSVDLLKSPYCKKILPISVNAYKILESKDFFDAELKEKIEILYPAYEDILIVSNYKQRNLRDYNKGVHILFIGNDFFHKGGDILLEVFYKLRKEFDIKLTIISAITNTGWITNPSLSEQEDIKRKIANSQNVRWLQNVPYKNVLSDIFPSADIFVLPTWGETFGHVLAEAESAGLPIISTNVRAIPEIVNNNENGFLINLTIDKFGNLFTDKVSRDNSRYYSVAIEENRKSVMKQLEKSLVLLIESRDLREEFGVRSRQIFKEKFSYEVRNKNLMRIYRSAL